MAGTGIAGRALVVGIAAAVLLALPAAARTGAAPVRMGQQGPARAKAQALAAYGGLPLAFVANAGQANPRIRYQAQAAGASFYFTRTKAVFGFTHGAKGVALELSFVGANRSPLIAGVGVLPGRLNYLIGKDPARWHTGLRTFREVVYRELWPGIDLAFRGDAGRLKYEFRLAPGADVSDIRLRYRGAERLSLARTGELRIHTSSGVLRDTRPVSYQTVGGRRVPVESGYALTGSRGYGFAVGAYDPRRPLVIDPGLVYTTFLGGGFIDIGRAIAVDAAGNAYVTGLFGSNQTFVTKLNATGSVAYTTVFGGSLGENGFGIAVDGSGNAYVTGRTTSTNFPTTEGAFDRTYNGGDGASAGDAFVTKLSPAGAFVYSTYLGGEFTDEGRAIAVDGAGNAYVAGSTHSFGFPATPGAFDTTYGGCCPGLSGPTDYFVTKLNPAGSALVYSTFLGVNNANDDASGIAVDAGGSAYVTGRVGPGFPTTAGAYDTTFNGGNDVAVTKLNAAGSALVYSTFIGGSSSDNAQGIGVDGTGNAYVTGQTSSTNFPLVNAFDTSLGGLSDGFVTKLNASGSGLVYSTYFGGQSDEGADAIAVDAAGNAHVTGRTFSSDFPTTPGAYRTTKNNSGYEAFVTKLSPAGSLAYSTFLPATLARGNGIAVDGNGNAYATGERDNSGNTDVFVLKLGIAAVPAALTLSPPSDVNKVGEEHCVTATVRDQFGNPVSGVSVVFSVSGANTAAGARTTNASGQATFCYTGTVAGADEIRAFADTDGDGIQDEGEPPGTATKTYVAAAPARLSLSPASDLNVAGEEHCVTATVVDQFGNPVSGVSVVFSVSGANTAAGAGTTDASGQAGFCYTGTTAGDDAISAFADTDGDGVQDADEPSGSATKTYTAAAPATLTLSPASDVNKAGEEHCVTATVRDRFGNPVSGVSVVFSVSGANTAAGTPTTNAGGQATFCYTGTVAGEDAIKAFADADADGIQDEDELSGTATKTYVAGAPATLTLSPATNTNPVGTIHTITATVSDAYGNRVANIVVRFSVTGSVTTSGTCTTGANGECDFTYQGPAFPGADLVAAFADTDADGVQDGDEPAGEASKSWVLPTSTPGQASGGGNFQFGDDRIAFGFSARNGDNGARGSCSVIDRAADVMVKCTDVTAFVISDNTVTVYGNAVVNGVATTYRIDAADNASRGKGADTFSIQTATGYMRSGTLAGGNVRVG